MNTCMLWCGQICRGHDRVCDEDGSAKAGAVLDMNVAQSFAHHAHVFECCNIWCQSVSVQVRYHTSALHDSACSILWLPTKDEYSGQLTFCPQPGCLKLLCRCIALHIWMAGPTGLEPAFPFREVEQVPGVLSGDPPEDAQPVGDLVIRHIPASHTTFPGPAPSITLNMLTVYTGAMNIH